MRGDGAEDFVEPTGFGVEFAHVPLLAYGKRAHILDQKRVLAGNAVICDQTAVAFLAFEAGNGSTVS